MSKIIAEKEQNKKTQYHQGTFFNISYDIPSSNNINIINSVSNSAPGPSIKIIDPPAVNIHQNNPNPSVEQAQTSNINQSATSNQAGPLNPIPDFQRNDSQIPNFNSHFTNNNTFYNIFGCEMNSREVDQLFESAEKSVGWSYWKINE